MSSAILRKNIVKISRFIQRPFSLSVTCLSDDVLEPPDTYELAVLNYEKRRNDPIETKRARLLYQSRKRGMLENDLLLSTFAAKYLPEMNATEIDEYDKIINLPSNDWDLFNWVMEMKPTPDEFENSVMQILKEHVKNVKREPRISQPPL